MVRTKKTVDEEISEKDLLEQLPRTWRTVVDEILGVDFIAKVEDRAHGNFVLFIYLPKHLDRRVGEKNGELDYSTGLLRRASALQDVQTWCEKIATNIKKTYPKFSPKKHENPEA